MYIRSQTTYSLNLLLITYLVIVSLIFCDTLFPVLLLHSLVLRNLKRQIIFIHTKDYLAITLKRRIAYMIETVYHLRTVLPVKYVLKWQAEFLVTFTFYSHRNKLSIFVCLDKILYTYLIRKLSHYFCLFEFV